MAGGFNIFQSALGQGLFKGAAGDYMRRPASNTNLPRTMASNLMERMAARPQTTFTGMSPGAGGGGMAPGTGGGTRPASPQSYVGTQGGAPRPTYQTTPAQPNLQRFVPFTGANGQSMLGGGAEGSAGSGGGWFGGFNPQVLQGVLGGGDPGQYRTALATLFPMFRGEGPRNSLTRDYFSGPIQPSFQEQFGYLQ